MRLHKACLQFALVSPGQLCCARLWYWVIVLLRQTQHVFPKAVRRVELCPNIMKHPHAIQDWKQLSGLPHMLAKFPGAAVNAFHVGRPIALSGDQRLSQCILQHQFVSGTFQRLRECAEHLQAPSQMADSLYTRRALERLLSGSLPVAKSLLIESRFGVMMGEQFGLGLDRLGKSLLQHLGNALVILLAGASE